MFIAVAQLLSNEPEVGNGLVCHLVLLVGFARRKANKKNII